MKTLRTFASRIRGVASQAAIGVGMAAVWLLVALIATPAVAHASIALLLEEPYGEFGGMNPTGHASVYLSRVCADSPVSLRRCKGGEQGVIISRYHRVGGYDWIALPPIPYLYAVDRADEVPASVNPAQVALMRDRYRRKFLEQVAPDAPGGRTPQGDWIQLVGAAYDRTLYAFEIATTEDQDNRFIQTFNTRRNKTHFNLFFYNCADFSRQAIDFFYPKAVHRNFTADVGIMTPKQAAKCLVRYSKRHPDLQFSSFAIVQVPGTVSRSGPVRDVLESLVRSKRYIVPLAPLAVIHPVLGGGLAFALMGSGHFNPRRILKDPESTAPPQTLAQELESNEAIPSPEIPSSSAALP